MQDTSAPIGFHLAALPLAQIIPVVFFLVFFVWAVYTVVAAFHWFRYAGNLTIALCAITTHVVVSLLLSIYAVSAL